MPRFESKTSLRWPGLAGLGCLTLLALILALPTLDNGFSLDDYNWLERAQFRDSSASFLLEPEPGQVFSPVGRGFFADEPLQPEAFHEADLRCTMPRFQTENYAANLEKLNATREIADELRCSVAELALAWVLAQGEHVVAIPGTTRVDHLEQNFGALQIDVPSEALDRINAIFDPVSVAGNRYSDAMQQTVDTECFDFEQYGG